MLQNLPRVSMNCRSVSRGGRRLLILDTAGTIISANSPYLAIRRTLNKIGLDSSRLLEAQITKDMGMAKEVHLRNLITQYFPQATSSAPREAIAIYPQQQLEIFHEHAELSQLNPYVSYTLEDLRQRFDMTIMLTSGFPRLVFDFILKRLKSQSVQFDLNMCSSEASSRLDMLKTGLLKSGLQNGCFVGDTRNDIESGIALKNKDGERTMFTVGIVHHSAEGPAARYELTKAKADVVVDDFYELMDLKYFADNQ
jgi:phosphoglycolate phosphatase-like HAD superfamily hydrolase